jgi:hypothetical protein
MARGVLDITANLIEEQRDRDIAELSDLISILFVKSKPKDNIKEIRKLIGTAIALKRDMVGDHAIYRWFFLDSDKPSPGDAWVSTAEDHSHPVPTICTFPGFMRLVLSDDGTMKPVPVAKAVAVVGFAVK